MHTLVKQPHEKELFGHPAGLYILFFTETWERFSYYGMRALLVTYMTATTLGNNAQSGLGWSSQEALALYGWYTMLVYISSIPGGMLADKLLGQKKTVFIGGIFLVIGHGVLAIAALWAYYTGLGFIIVGVGLLKPNISSMVGGLYKKEDVRRDKGFSIFYVGINLGSLLSSVAVGLVVVKYGWHAGFGLAGIGMFFGLLVYMYGYKYLLFVGNKPTEAEKKADIGVARLFSQLRHSPKELTIFLVLLVLSLYAGFSFEGSDSWGFGALFIFLSFVTALLMMLYKQLETKIEKDRYIVLLLSFLLVIVFWGAFEQVGGLMNLYAKTKTDRILLGYEIPTAFFQGINAAFIILFAVLIANIWAKRRLKNKEASSLFKMAVGIVIMGFGFLFMVGASQQYEAMGSSAMYWLFLAYFFHTMGELCLSPVSLSFVTKLAPAKYAAFMMGVYWAATGLGNKVAGIVGEKASEFGELTIFAGISVTTIVFGLLVVALLKPLKRLAHGAEAHEIKINTNEAVRFKNTNN